jgi:hypothetical protein
MKGLRQDIEFLDGDLYTGPSEHVTLLFFTRFPSHIVTGKVHDSGGT